MNRIFQITVLSCLGLALTGCNGSEKNKPIWEDTKIGDLAPTQGRERPDVQLLKTVNFDVHIFEVPAENISRLNDIRRTLSGKQLLFYNYYAFSANSFSIGFGQFQILDKTISLLEAAGAKKARTASIMLPPGRADDLPIAALRNKQTISYISTDKQTEAVTIGPGLLSLRIKTDEIPGSTIISNVTALPVFSPSNQNPQLTPFAKSGEFFFTPAGFRLKMSPGNFVLLAPQKYVSSQATLSGLFFSKPEGTLFSDKTWGSQPAKAKRKPAVRVFLLICTRIID